jgi:hypothetical protein
MPLEPPFYGCANGCRTRKITPSSVKGHYCENCGSGLRLEIDHAIPKSRGGCECEHNLWTLCRKCNRSKHALTIAEFYESGLAEWLRKEQEREDLILEQMDQMDKETRDWFLAEDPYWQKKWDEHQATPHSV